MRGRSRLSVVLFGGAAIFLGVAAMAWACTNPATSSVHPNNARPGDTVSFSGSNFPAGTVNIYWQDTWVDSAQVTSGGFVVSLTVPEVVDGAYWIYAHFDGSEGRDVVGSCLGVSASGGRTCQTAGGDETAPTEPGNGYEENPDSGDGVHETNPGEGRDGGEGRNGGRERSDARPDSSRSRDASGSRTPSGTGTVVTGTVTAVGAPPVIRTEDGTRVFGASLGRQAGKTEGLSGPYGSKLGSEPAWSAASGMPSLRPVVVGGLADPSPAASPYRAYLLAGAALFAVGLVLLLGGSVVAEVRRTRARAQVSHRRHDSEHGLS